METLLLHRSDASILSICMRCFRPSGCDVGRRWWLRWWRWSPSSSMASFNCKLLPIIRKKNGRSTYRSSSSSDGSVVAPPSVPYSYSRATCWATALSAALAAKTRHELPRKLRRETEWHQQIFPWPRSWKKKETPSLLSIRKERGMYRARGRGGCMRDFMRKRERNDEARQRIYIW